MAEMTNQAFESWVDSNINTNGTRAITGALLNEALTNISNSLYFALTKTKAEQVNEHMSNIITFDVPFSAGSTYQLIVRAFDSNGNNVDYQIISQDVTGFVVAVSVDCTIHYFTIKNN
jgi:hypothetical protein